MANARSNNNKIIRYIIFLIGLFINSLGVSIITKADLGTSPISSIPYVLSLNFPFTLGMFTVVFSIVLILLQLIILRKDFKFEHVLQIPVSILFGYFIDMTMLMMEGITFDMYIAKIGFLILGCIVLGVGVYTEVLADVAMLPGESFVRAVSMKLKTEFGMTKVCFDVSLAVIAAAISFVFAHQLQGIREGTIIAALVVGYIARLMGRKLPFLKAWLDGNGVKENMGDASAIYSDNSIETGIVLGEVKEGGIQKKKNWVITIGRQYGSGGREIGRYLAENLGYKFYDRELITEIAGVTGYSEKFVEKKSESNGGALIFNLVNQMYGYTGDEESPKDTIFAAQSEVIRKCAEEGNCVIVGRCSDYILKNYDYCISIYLHAPLDYRVKRIMNTEYLEEIRATQEIEKIDKRRAGNYRHYTRQIWGHANHYDLCIDSRLGKEYVLTAIIEAMKLKAKKEISEK